MLSDPYCNTRKMEEAQNKGKENQNISRYLTLIEAVMTLSPIGSFEFPTLSLQDLISEEEVKTPWTKREIFSQHRIITLG